MNAGRREQRRNRRAVAVGVAIRQDQDVVARFDGAHRALVEVFQRALEAGAVLPHVEQHRDPRRAEPGLVDVPELRQLVVVDDRVLDLDLPARLRARIEQVALGPDRRLHRRDELLADRVERRVGDLREDLLEVVVEQARTIRQRGERRVGAHRAERLLALRRHRREQQPQIFVRVAEQLLAPRDRFVARRRQVRRRIELFDVDEVRQPVLVGLRRRQLPLHLVVRHDPSARRIDQEDPAGMQPFLQDDVLRRDVQHADLGGHDDEVVLGHVVARRPQAVAIENRADHRAVRERDRRRAVPRLHQRRVILVERAELGRHRRVVLPRLRDHHQDRVRQRPPGHHQELEDVVEGRGVAAAFADDRQDLLQVVAEQRRDDSSPSRARIQLMLPVSVLISPLCAM